MGYKQDKRNEKAEALRSLRKLKLTKKQIADLAEMQYGKPTKETLGDYWIVREYKQDGVRCLEQITYYGDGESWNKTWLLDGGDWTDEDIMHTFGIYEYYRGAGQPYAQAPWVQRSKHSTLIKQHGGLDI